MIPTITFSNEILVFQKGSQECNFLINNNSKDIIVYFKVKTTKLNTYEVKPAKGSIMPEQNKGIHFKIVQPLLNIEQVQNIQAKDKFMLQFLKVSTQNNPKSKKQLEEFWTKQKRQQSKSIQVFTLSIRIQNNFVKKEVPLQPIEPNSPSVFSRKGTFDKKRSIIERNSMNFNEEKNKDLAVQFQKLKEQEEDLLKKRDEIFVPPELGSKEKGKNSISQIIALFIIFLVGLVLGNFLKLRVFI